MLGGLTSESGLQEKNRSSVIAQAPKRALNPLKRPERRFFLRGITSSLDFIGGL